MMVRRTLRWGLVGSLCCGYVQADSSATLDTSSEQASRSTITSWFAGGSLPQWWASFESATLSLLRLDDALSAAISSVHLPFFHNDLSSSYGSAVTDPMDAASYGYEEDSRLQAATFRSAGSVYFKGKAGYLNLDEENREDLFSQLTFTEMVTEFDRGSMIGLGAGYRLSRSERLEFEYIVNKKDEQVLSVGYTF